MDIETKETNNKPVKEEEAGPLVGSIIIVLIVIAGGLYFFNSIKENISSTENQDGRGADVENVETNEDLNLEYIGELNAELDEIEAEIEVQIEADARADSEN